MRIGSTAALAALFSLLGPPPLHAQGSTPQPDTAGAYMDAGAVTLLQRARSARLDTDRSLRSYTADVRARGGADMRMPLKDRTLVRVESASRVRWSRDAQTIVQVQASRVRSPGGESIVADGFGITDVFDPSQDRLYFGMSRDSARRSDNDDYWIEHPLGELAEQHYRYQSGDTMTIRLQDGSVVRVIELRVIPRRNDPHTVRGVLWVDSRSGALVQAAFRLARRVDIMRDLSAMDDEDARIVRRMPLITPLEFDISLMTVEYGLWEMTHWLPRSMRFEGMMRAGVMHFPGAMEVSYRMLDVVTDRNAPPVSEAEAVAQVLAEWHAGGDYVVRPHDRRRQQVLVPRDTAALMRDPRLPPPVWRDAAGFPTEAELRSIADRLGSLGAPARPDLPVTLGWGLAEPGMVRYNRVEALSVGARLAVPLPHVTASAVARLGAGDLHPNAAVELRHERLRRAFELRGYHELATTDPASRALGAGNSLSAALFGRDEGEYYRATGASLAMSPPPLGRQTWVVRAYAERQDDVERGTHVSLPRAWRDSVFRPNIVADAATQYGALLQLRPWWGTDPRGAQLGLDVMVQAEAGDFEHVRGRVTLRTAAPLAAGARIGVELGAGTSEGNVPVQRLFHLGGASTLRGYEPSTVRGTSMARGRLEIARASPWGNLALFSDWGWSGDRDDVRGADQRLAVGAGISLLDGLVRLDVARGLRAPRGWRLDLHLDSLL